MRRILLLAALCAPLFAQADAPAISASDGPPPKPYQKIFVYTGSNLDYVCYAPSNVGRERTITVTTASNAAAAAFTATAHGFDYQSAATTTPIIKITGATGNWAGINGVWTATPTSANAFTIAVNSSTFGAWGSQSVTVTTLAPRTTDTVWAIEKFVYDASGNVIWRGWAASPGGAGATTLKSGSQAFSFACASRTTYSYQ